MQKAEGEQFHADIQGYRAYFQNRIGGRVTLRIWYRHSPSWSIHNSLVNQDLLQRAQLNERNVAKAMELVQKSYELRNSLQGFLVTADQKLLIRYEENLSSVKQGLDLLGNSWKGDLDESKTISEAQEALTQWESDVVKPALEKGRGGSVDEIGAVFLFEENSAKGLLDFTSLLRKLVGRKSELIGEVDAECGEQ